MYRMTSLTWLSSMFYVEMQSLHWYFLSILAWGETCVLKHVFNYGNFLQEMSVLTELWTERLLCDAVQWFVGYTTLSDHTSFTTGVSKVVPGPWSDWFIRYCNEYLCMTLGMWLDISCWHCVVCVCTLETKIAKENFQEKLLWIVMNRYGNYNLILVSDFSSHLGKGNIVLHQQEKTCTREQGDESFKSLLL